MSETLEQTTTQGEPVSVEDLQRMLDDTRKEKETIQRERDAERSGRSRAEQERDAERTARLLTETETDKTVASEAERRYNAELDAVKSGITAQKGALAAAKQTYARAAEAGDWTAAGDAQEAIAQAAARLTTFEGKHEYLEGNKEKLIAPPTSVRRAEPTPTADPISRLISGRIEPAERAWLEKRPKFVDDPGYRNKVFGASQFAVGAGFQRGSEPYFKEIERILGEGETETTIRQETPRPAAREPSADMAPQRRPAPGQQPQGGGREIRLSADEAEIADNLYGQPNSEDYIAEPGKRYEKYYLNKQRQIERGRMTA